ncbi:MAG TPA: hypothetical protein VEK35_07610 [Roseiarcus sp.]|nr:hypothetical protein [Roseiarcus sp.]
MERPAIEHPITDNIYVTLLCALIVALYAWKRYNTPETNRLSTTRSLFLFTGAGYIAATLSLFFLLCEVVLKPGVLSSLGLEDFQKMVKEFSAPPVLSAVLLTTLLPNTPVINEADAWLLKRFQAWGRIPQGVRSLADKLTPSAQRLGENDVAQLRDWIINDGDAPNELANDVGVDTPESSRGTLSRVVALYSNLQALGANPPYVDAFRERQEAWQSIKADFRVFVAQSEAFFVLFDHLSNLQGAAEEAALHKARKCYREICLNLHKEMAVLLAQIVLIVEATDRRIYNRLQSIGFSIAEKPCPPLEVGPFLFMGLMMILGIFFVVALVPPPPGHELPVPVIGILIGATRTIGVVAAILPKLRWSEYRTDERGNPPYLGWLAWSFLAGLSSLLIERGMIAIVDRHFLAAANFAKYPLTPMAPLAFLTCLSIAILCDIDLGFGVGWGRRIMEGVICAAATTIGVFICIHILSLTPATEGRAPDWLPVVVSSTLGFVCGVIGPHLYRRARNEALASEMAPIQAT